jgi:gas vesicle protein
MKNMASAQDTKTQLDDLRGLFRKEMEKYFSRLNQVENELNMHKAAVKKVDEFTPLLKKLMEEFNTRLSNQRDHIESNSERINAQIEATNIFIREIEGNTKLNFTGV